jgi:hypothetical protein
MGRFVASAVVALVVASAFVSSSGAAPPASVVLSLVRHDGYGHTTRAALSCQGNRARGTGFLAGRAAATACAEARRHVKFLSKAPAKGRRCGEHEGNQATARVRGHVGGRHVNRAFTAKTDCGVLDWLRVGKLLGGVPTEEQ